MPLTDEQIKARIVSRLSPKYQAALDWAGLVSSVQAASSDEKAQLVDALKNGNIAGTGRKLAAMIQGHILAQSAAEADSMLSDGALSLEELSRVFE